MKEIIPLDEKVRNLHKEIWKAIKILEAGALLEAQEILPIILALILFNRRKDISERDHALSNEYPLTYACNHAVLDIFSEQIWATSLSDSKLDLIPSSSERQVFKIFDNLDLTDYYWSDQEISEALMEFIEEWSKKARLQDMRVLPYDLCKMIVNILDPNLIDEVYVPRFGHGELMIAAMNHLRAKLLSKKKTKPSPQSNSNNTINLRGDELNYNKWASTSIILGIAGYDLRSLYSLNFIQDYLSVGMDKLRRAESEIPKRFRYPFSRNIDWDLLLETLAKTPYENYLDSSEIRNKTEKARLWYWRWNSARISDVVILAPPWGMKVPEKYPNYMHFWDYDLKVPRDHAEFLFLLIALNFLKAKGKIGMLIPAENLSKGGRIREIWSMLIHLDYLEAVVTIAKDIGNFKNMKLALIIINKDKSAKKKDKVAFLNMESDVENQSGAIKEKQIDEVTNFIKTYERIGSNSAIVPVERIQENEYDLDPDRYTEAVINELKTLLEKKRGAELGVIGDLVIGKNKKRKFNPEGIPCVRINDLAQDLLDPFLDLSGVRTVTPVEGDRLIDNKCIIISLVGDKLRPTIYNPDILDGAESGLNAETPGRPGIIAGPDLAIILPDNKNVDVEYLYYQLLDPFVISQLETFRKKDGVPKLSLEDLKSIVIPLSKSVEDQNEIVRRQKRYLVEISAVKNRANKERRKLMAEKEEAEFSIVRHLAHSIKPKIQIAKSPLKSIHAFLKDKKLIDEKCYEKMDGSFEKVGEAFEKTFKTLNQIGDVLDNCRKLVTNEIRKEDFKMVDICKMFQKELMPLHTNKPYKILFECHVNSPVKIHKESFIEALNNLIKNAEDHAFPGKVEGAELRFIFKDEGDFLVIDYTNNGLPFPHNMNEDDFFTYGKKRFDSTGDGLGGAWIGKVIKAHQGTLEIIQDDNPLHFRISLPKEIT